MFEKGQKVRVKAKAEVMSRGLVGIITDVEPVVDEETPAGSQYCEVTFDDRLEWLNDYELEAVE